MHHFLKTSILSLFLVFALITAMGLGLTYAPTVLLDLNPNFFVLAIIFYVFSVILWLISWAYLIKKRKALPYSRLVVVGLTALYGALTPVQVGSEALRSLRLKEFFGVPYSDSIAASLVAKGTKFLILSIVASMALLFFLNTKTDPVFFFGFLSGFIVVLLVSILFLFPFEKKASAGLLNSLERLSKPLPFFSRVHHFFARYSASIDRLTKEEFFLLLFLSALSWAFEFFALQYSFFSLGIVLSFHSLLLLMVMISVLERAPLLPRGIGLVEIMAWHFLAFPELIAGITLSAAQIIALLAVYDLVRLVIPTLLSVLVWLASSKRLEKEKSDYQPARDH
ncbi:MAG TPA: flippase-like domain-containing protein [Candidatus Diapherotrites archaeon]|uniref:Flippase-like domain-containing protein n=2 Tax=Candidatus Iainarchaeum sp. TaxID=3101447 RepID=A0A7J4JH87_9ARCH|nr:flippase-like domain-containing protein [Candidatus Diapherotrites archaeon]